MRHRIGIDQKLGAFDTVERWLKGIIRQRPSKHAPGRTTPRNERNLRRRRRKRERQHRRYVRLQARGKKHQWKHKR